MLDKIVLGIINGLESIFGYKMADTILTTFVSIGGLLLFFGILYVLFHTCKLLRKWVIKRKKNKEGG
jgi:uncharacterized membrane protein